MALLQFANEPLHIVEVPVPCVAIEENWNGGRVGHKFQVVQNLSPTGLIIIAHPKLCGDRESAPPNSSKPGLLHDLCTQPIMGLANKLQLVGEQ